MVTELLKKAEILTERDPHGRAVTFNNMACLSRQQGRLHASLAYLQKALKIESRLRVVNNPADTHLNLCAVLSQLSRHEEALSHAQAALALLQEELFGGPHGAAGAAQKPDRIAVLAITYHNLGVECEFLKQHSGCLAAYTKGVEIASVYLGPQHGITATLKNSQLAAARLIDDARRGRGVGRGGTARVQPRLPKLTSPRAAGGAGGGAGTAAASGSLSAREPASPSLRQPLAAGGATDESPAVGDAGAGSNTARGRASAASASSPRDAGSSVTAGSSQGRGQPRRSGNG
jgi:tetratricopeptide (TPR) repeat protein